MMIMENTALNVRRDLNNMKFDLKGSTFHREVYFNENFWLKEMRQRKIMKDVNFMKIQKSIGSHLIFFDQLNCSTINSVIASDTQFLAERNLMDYSLLLVVESQPDFNVEQPYIYFRAINNSESDYINLVSDIANRQDQSAIHI
jgi:hypothetical protein